MAIFPTANLATIHRFIPAPYSVCATLVCSEDEDASQFHCLWLDFAVRCERARTKFTIDNRTGGPTGAGAPAGGVEPSRPGEFYVRILELVGAHVFFRGQDYFRMASQHRALSQDLSERRPRDGQAGILRSEYRSSLVRLGVCAWHLALN